MLPTDTQAFLQNITPGDLRDTTTPIAMLHNLHKFVLRDVLKLATREMLKDWLIANKTGADSLRAGIPADWVIGCSLGRGKAQYCSVRQQERGTRGRKAPN